MPSLKRPRSTARSAPYSAPGSSQSGVKKAKTSSKRNARLTPEMYTPAQTFPDVMTTTLRYNSNMARANPAAASTYYSFYLNGMFDFDVDNFLGNKQPLYYDELLTADGPYRNYKVKSWDTKIILINKSPEPLLVYWSQANAIAESDSLLEVQNRPNVQELILTNSDGDKNMGTIISKGNVRQIHGSIRNPTDLTGSPSANPSVACYGTLFFYNPGGVAVTPVDCWVKIVHDFHVELATADAVSS